MFIIQLLILNAALGVGLLAIRGRMLFLTLLVAHLVGQNLMIMLSLRHGLVDVYDAPKLFFFKELLILSGVTVVMLRSPLLRRGAFSPAEGWILVLGAYLLLSAMMFSSTPLMFRMAEARNIVLLPLLYMLGLRLGLDADGRRVILRLLIVLGVGLAGFGLVERLLLDEQFWLSVGHEEYYWMREQRPLNYTLYGNMYFWDFGFPLRRLATVVGDPLMAGSLLVMLTLASIALGWFAPRGSTRRDIYRLLVVLLLMPALVLTLSRSAMLALGFGCGLLVLSRLQSRWFEFIIGGAVVSALLVGLLLGDVMLEYITGASHLKGLQEGMAGAVSRPLGHGLGTTGTLADTLQDNATGASEGLGDSFMGSVAYQLGLPGLILVYLAYHGITRDLYRAGLRLRGIDDAGRWLCTAIAAVMAGLLLASLVSGSVYSVVGSGLTFLFGGIMTAYARAKAPAYQQTADASNTSTDSPSSVAVLQPSFPGGLGEGSA